MKVQGQHRFEAAPKQVWEALLDPEVLASTLPGFQALEQVGENEYAGTLALGVGPVQGRFEGRLELFDLTELEGYSLRMSGRGTPGFVDGKGRVRLQQDGAHTVMSYDVDINVGGRIAGVGQRLLDMTSRMLTQQAIKSLARQIADRSAS